jgi:hypothetical protein
MLETNHLASFLGSLNDPCMWLSVLVWGLKTRNSDAAILVDHGVPQYQIAREGYFNLMMLLAVPPRQWSTLYDIVSFDTMVALMPADKANGLSYLADSLLRLTDDFPSLSRLAVGWRAALAVYPTNEVVCWLVQHITDKYSFCSQIEDCWRVFERAGQLFLVAVDGDPVKIRQAIYAVLEIMNNRPEEIFDGEGLGRFCAMLLLALNWEEYGREVLAKLLDPEMLHRSRESACDPFIMTLIRVALFVPEMREWLPTEIANVILEKDGWPLAVSFFLALGDAPQLP